MLDRSIAKRIAALYELIIHSDGTFAVITPIGGGPKAHDYSVSVTRRRSELHPAELRLQQAINHY
jgi:hypothetical protein